MNTYVITLVLLGAVILLTAWLPMAMRKLPLSLPICCVALGMLLAWSPFPLLPALNPLKNRVVTEHLTEFVLIVSLMGAGLKIDRQFRWRRWATTWRLLAIAMPLCIATIAFLGWSVLGLGVASALLLGGALAPTDPVLAADVQVGPPQTGRRTIYASPLTSEAGLNDALSFPFVIAAIALAEHPGDMTWFGHWIAVDVAVRLLVGIGMGWICGHVLGYLTFCVPWSKGLAKTGDGFVALGFACLAYGVTELVHGYGFLAVFVAALTLRTVERQNSFHRELHDFGEQIERLMMMILLVCFGSVVAEGSLLAAADWRIVLVAVLTIAVVRPLCAWMSLIGSLMPKNEKAIVSVFGIRGLGSIYYLAYATGQANFERSDIVWATVLLIVLISIVVHGVAVTPVMRWIDRSRGIDSMVTTVSKS